jgi:hypothetical protein
MTLHEKLGEFAKYKKAIRTFCHLLLVFSRRFLGGLSRIVELREVKKTCQKARSQVAGGVHALRWAMKMRRTDFCPFTQWAVLCARFVGS